jgi:hypothetical protein
VGCTRIGPILGSALMTWALILGLYPTHLCREALRRELGVCTIIQPHTHWHWYLWSPSQSPSWPQRVQSRVLFFVFFSLSRDQRFNWQPMRSRLYKYLDLHQSLDHHVTVLVEKQSSSSSWINCSLEEEIGRSSDPSWESHDLHSHELREMLTWHESADLREFCSVLPNSVWILFFFSDGFHN